MRQLFDQLEISLIEAHKLRSKNSYRFRFGSVNSLFDWFLKKKNKIETKNGSPTMRSKISYALSWSGDVENIISGFFQLALREMILMRNYFALAITNFNN